MEITLSDNAIEWFENKFPLDEGEAVRFFGKTYGSTEVHDGFSVGLETGNPDKHDDLLAISEENGRQYFAIKEDEWFFGDYDLEIDLDNEFNEPEYHFNEA